jgi:hypothetical protein
VERVGSNPQSHRFIMQMVSRARSSNSDWPFCHMRSASSNKTSAAVQSFSSGESHCPQDKLDSCITNDMHGWIVEASIQKKRLRHVVLSRREYYTSYGYLVWRGHLCVCAHPKLAASTMVPNACRHFSPLVGCSRSQKLQQFSCLKPSESSFPLPLTS